MDLHELRAFLAVAEELNFRKAAERLAMSQPPLTRLIAKLEDELKVQLFKRSTRKVELTGAGIALLPEARQILEKVGEAERLVREVGRLKKGELQIHFSPSAFYSAWPRLMWAYRERFPHVELSFRQGPSAELHERLRRGTADLVLTDSAPDSELFESRLVHRENLGVLLPERHPLAKRKRIRLRDLDGETIILHPRREAPAYYDALVGLFEREGLRPRIRLRGEGEGCPLLVAMGEGVLFALQKPQIHEALGTSFVSLEGPGPQWSVHAAWRKTPPSVELESFLGFLDETISLQGPPQLCVMGSASRKALS